MELALECSTDLLEVVQPFADFDWVLAHKLKDDEVYKSFYQESSNVKFLDNSVNELGEPLSFSDMKELAEEIEAHYIVSPDWIGDAKRTVEAYREALEKIGKERLVGVVQGSTFKEAFGCLLEYQGPIAIPYDICSSKEDPPFLMGLRRALFVAHIPTDKMVHLLGFTGLEELFWYKNKSNVMSIDTGIPVMLGLMERDILDGIEDKKSNTWDKMQGIELTQVRYTGICRNLALLRKEIS